MITTRAPDGANKYEKLVQNGQRGLELPFTHLDQRILILITNFVFDDQNLLLTTDSFSSSTEIYVLQEEVF